MKLDEYKKKRDRAATNEPFGEEPAASIGPTRQGAFVIHLHDATRRHYDLRLEVGGVLTSFAVPRGPSLDPSDRRLAVHTEDHPIEYLDFEAVIPEGLYGAGAMILWDEGRVRYLGESAERGLAAGKLDFELVGMKIKGRFSLVRIKGEDKEWLLLKKSDAWANKGDPVRDKPRSILSALTVDELAGAEAIGLALVDRARSLGARPIDERAFDARKLVPMLCALEGAKLSGDEWLYELKLDGVRALGVKEQGGVAVIGRKLRDVTVTYPEVARALRALPVPRAVLDGEVVTFDAEGRPSFERLAQRMHLTKAHEVRLARIEVPVIYVAFDLLAIGDLDLRSVPLVTRKALLAALLPSPGILRALDHHEGDARPLLAFAEARRLEGVVAKRRDSLYLPGPKRTAAWVKIKRERDEDLVVVGYTKGEGAREALGALDVASFEGSTLVNRGKVGSGLDGPAIRHLIEVLAKRTADTCAATGELAPAPRGRTHVRPEVVVRVRFAGLSESGQIRHGRFLGVRDDVEPASCTLGAASDGDVEANAPSAPEPSSMREPSPPVITAAEDEGPLPITNPNKVLWPKDGLKKRDLCEYYTAVAKVMVPYLRGRPISLVRYPDGIEGKSFYQWNVPLGTPPWVKTYVMDDGEGKRVEVFLVDDPRTLAHVANLAAIPIHVLASRASSIDHCDFSTIDFDVKDASLAAGITLALSLAEILAKVGLEGYPKTSGQTGLHVLVPLGAGASYTTAKVLADLLGRLLVHKHPSIATMERMIHKRGPKVYVDTGQTGPTRTIVAPYSVRAKPGATVSAPLLWSEVGPALDPRAFTIRTLPARINAIGDPMRALLTDAPDLMRAVAKLGEIAKTKSW